MDKITIRAYDSQGRLISTHEFPVESAKLVVITPTKPNEENPQFKTKHNIGSNAEMTIFL